MVNPTPSTWALLVFGDRRTYQGNPGYSDEPTVYRYDSFVPNHRNLKVGDVAILRDHERIFGWAVIESIVSKHGSKVRRTCPECGSTDLKERITMQPRYRCSNRHTFDQPRLSDVACTIFEASFPTTFVIVSDDIPAKAIVPAQGSPREQLAIRSLAPERIPADVAMLLGWDLLELKRPLLDLPTYVESETLGFVVDPTDRRLQVLRAIRARHGQARFRSSLRQRYGDRCMSSGCEAMEVVEAAHISPYRGSDDNHVDNGLLLRADLRTLFDLNRLAIEPDTLKVRFHPDVVAHGYDAYHERPLLIVGPPRPSVDALVARWESVEFVK